MWFEKRDHISLPAPPLLSAIHDEIPVEHSALEYRL